MNLNFLTDKNFALACLVLQNTFLILFMRYSREKSEPELDGTPAPMYASSTAVTMMELLKLFCCIFMTGYEAGGISGLGIIKPFLSVCDLLSNLYVMLLLSSSFEQ